MNAENIRLILANAIQDPQSVQGAVQLLTTVTYNDAELVARTFVEEIKNSQGHKKNLLNMLNLVLEKTITFHGLFFEFLEKKLIDLNEIFLNTKSLSIVETWLEFLRKWGMIGVFMCLGIDQMTVRVIQFVEELKREVSDEEGVQMVGGRGEGVELVMQFQETRGIYKLMKSHSLLLSEFEQVAAEVDRLKEGLSRNKTQGILELQRKRMQLEKIKTELVELTTGFYDSVFKIGEFESK